MRLWNSTVASISARALIGRRRALLLLPLPLLIVGLAALSESLGAVPLDWAEPVIHGLAVSVALPVVALIVGTGVLGAEIDDGTIVHVLAKPLARREIVFSKYVVATAISALTMAVPLAIVGAMAASGRFALALVVAGTVGAAVYTALFVLLSLLTRRPVLIGLGYVLIWETILGNVLRGTRQLSIQQYVITITEKLAPTDLFKNTVSLSVAIVMSAIIVVGGLVLAVDRLRSFSVAGETS